MILREISDKMDKIIDLLEELTGDQQTRPQVPVIPTIPVAPPTFPRATTRCPRCHMDFSGITGYVCSQPDCPTGMGPVMS